jgi:nucleoside recognition membrane protein YjiH
LFNYILAYSIDNNNIYFIIKSFSYSNLIHSVVLFNYILAYSIDNNNIYFI